MYRGRTSYPPGRAFGHEVTGEVVELGASVRNLEVGDWVSIPFNVSCGTCDNCKLRKTSICLRANKDQPGGALGFADMGGPVTVIEAVCLSVGGGQLSCC
jgi:glutathione-independent formaldehyde dehydrogenase